MMNKKLKKSGPVGTIVFLVLFAAVVIGIYLAITRNKKDSDTKEIPAETSEADVLIKKDLIFDYPATPREVVKLFARITKCLYNDDLTDDQMRKLVSKVRGLYADELLEKNNEDDQLSLIKGERSDYRKDNRVIYSYFISGSGENEKLETKGGSTTLVKMYFTLKAGADMKRAYEEFSLIEDDDGKWKIVGWKEDKAQA